MRNQKWMKILVWAAGLPLSLSASSSWAEDPNPCARIVSISGDVEIKRESNPNFKVKRPMVGMQLYELDSVVTQPGAVVKLLMNDKSIIDIGPESNFRFTEYKQNGGADRKVTLQLNYGKIRTAVNQKIGSEGKYQVRTKSMVMGVRGTEFVVDAAPLAAIQANVGGSNAAADALKTTVTVLEGKVAVDNPGNSNASFTNSQVMLTEGKQLSAGTEDLKVPSAGAGTGGSSGAMSAAATDGPKAPAVVDLSPQQTQQVAAKATVADRTFSQAVTLDTPKNSGDSGSSAPGASSERGPASASNDRGSGDKGGDKAGGGASPSGPAAPAPAAAPMGPPPSEFAQAAIADTMSTVSSHMSAAPAMPEGATALQLGAAGTGAALVRDVMPVAGPVLNPVIPTAVSQAFQGDVNVRVIFQK